MATPPRALSILLGGGFRARALELQLAEQAGDPALDVARRGDDVSHLEGMPLDRGRALQLDDVSVTLLLRSQVDGAGILRFAQGRLQAADHRSRLVELE